MAGTPGTGALTQGRHEGPPAPRAGEDPDASPAPPVSQSANGSRAPFNREPPWFRARLGAPGPWGRREAAVPQSVLVKTRAGPSSPGTPKRK